MVIRAKVQSGRIIVDEPTSLPDGTTLNLVVDDDGDDLSAEHLQRAYELCCRHCNHHYGANGLDIFQRRCPSCQDGAPGLSLE